MPIHPSCMRVEQNQKSPLEAFLIKSVEERGRLTYAREGNGYMQNETRWCPATKRKGGGGTTTIDGGGRRSL